MVKLCKGDLQSIKISQFQILPFAKFTSSIGRNESHLYNTWRFKRWIYAD